MGRTKTTNRESRQSREESAESSVTFGVEDATRVIEAKVDDLRNEVGQDLESKVISAYLESGKVKEAREYAQEHGIGGEELRSAAGPAILALVGKGENELASRIASEVGHDEESLEDLLADPELEETVASRLEREMVAEEIGSPLLRTSA